MRPRWLRRRGALASRSALLLALALAVGCGGGQGTVSGRVLYKDKPLPGGWLTFRPTDSRQNTVPVRIDDKGRYEATLPTGEVQIAVDNRELERLPAGPAPKIELPPGIKLPPGAKAGGGAPAPAPAPGPADAPEKLAGKYVPIPPKCCDAAPSGLRYTVQSGPQPHDIELK